MRQFSNQQNLIIQSVKESNYWQDFIDHFDTCYKVFINDIKTNVYGYDKILAKITKNDTPIKKAEGFTLKWLNNPQPGRLYDYLIDENLIDNTTSKSQVVAAFSGGKMIGFISWVGDLGQLKFFLHKLVKRGMLTATKTDFQKANSIFNLRGNPLKSNDLNDAHYPSEEKKLPIVRIANKLKTIGVFMNDIDF